MRDINTEWKELRPKIGNLISHINSENYQINVKLKELQEKEESQVDLQAKIDEAYNKGLEDARNAVLQLYENQNWYEIFGTCYNFNILTNHSMAEIIEKENQLKVEKDKKDKELHVGDEVMIDSGHAGIITDVGDDDSIVWIVYRITPEVRGLDSCWVNSANCKKTGRHFDSIPFDYNPEKEEENK